MSGKEERLLPRLGQETVEVGDEGYLIHTTNVSPNAIRAGKDDPYWCLSSLPGRKNMDRSVCLDGWLGTTDDISQYAEGYVRVVRLTRSSVWVVQMTPPTTKETT